MKAEGATHRIIPVEIKAQVVEALRHIANSNEANRERITKDKVIPGTRACTLVCACACSFGVCVFRWVCVCVCALYACL